MSEEVAKSCTTTTTPTMPVTSVSSCSILKDGENGSISSLAKNGINSEFTIEDWKNISSVDAQTNNRINTVSKYLIALRPWSFPASITPVALGSTLAYKTTGSFHPVIFGTTIFTALCVHAAGNLVNTYYDYLRGIDNKKSDDRTLVDKLMSPNDVAWFGGLLYFCGCLGCLTLTFISSAKVEHLTLVYFCGLSSSFLYTGGLGLKYIALGDLLIVFTFGPLTVVFAYLSQTGHLNIFPLFYAIPIALKTEAILHSNNARDMESDKQAGIITLAILLGQTGSYVLFCFLLFVPYIIFIIFGLHVTFWMFLPVFSIVLAFRLEKQFRRGELYAVPKGVAKLNLVMGSLYIAGCLLSQSSSLPGVSEASL